MLLAKALRPPCLRKIGREGRSGRCTSPVVRMSLVSPQQGQVLFCSLASCAALAQVLSSRTKWGERISPPLLAIGVGATLSSFNLIPTAAPMYDTVCAVFMPVAVSLTLLETNVQRAFTDAGSTLKAFWIGAIGTVIGTLASFLAVGRFLGPDGWKIASCLCASYIGGSINYAATAQALGLTSRSTLAAGMAADNLAMAVYFSVIMSISASHKHGFENASEDTLVENGKPTTESLLLSIASATLSCILGNAIANVLPSTFAGSGLALMAIVASIMSTAVAHFSLGSSKIHAFAGSESLGGTLMLIYFAVLGASCSFQDAISAGWPLFSFILLLLTIHLGIILGVGSRCKLPVPVLLIASNANVGGPATAAAMANVCCWRGLVHPAILVGTLGYTIGTFIGCVVGTGALKLIVSKALY